jgi:CheY-like chemotaxis protein
MTTTSVNLLLADDDMDDYIFFKDVLRDIPIAVTFNYVRDGVELMDYLAQKDTVFPDVIYLDLNMPRKNGYDCLKEIKKDARLMHLPVIIYSTSYAKEIADSLYDIGAHLYIRKPADYANLKKVILKSIYIIAENKNIRPPKEDFVVSHT